MDTAAEPIKSLADELIADLDDLGDDSDVEDEKGDQGHVNGDGTGEGEGKERENNDSNSLPVDASTIHSDDIEVIAPLFFSDKFQKHMQAVAKAKSTEHGPIVGPVEEDEEYNLIVDSNALVANIENEMTIIHKYVRDKYAQKFPELEGMVPAPLDYIRTVRRIGNEMDVNNVDLTDILPAHSVMIVTVTSSTTEGQPLSDEDLGKVNHACESAMALEEAKKEVLDYVASRMSLFAPNLSQLVGTAVAARLMGIAGGLIALSRIPSCNVQVLGNSKKVLAGFSKIATERHIGVVQFAPVIQTCPQVFRTKAVRVLSGKLVLCARIDAYGESPEGASGKRFREEIEKKIEKWQEPPPAKRHKALPIPDAQSKKKRGGRRYRAMKERMAVTELQKRANRMEFAKSSDDGDGTGLSGFGGSMGPPSSTGRLRHAPLEAKGVARNTKKMTQRLKAYGGSSGATNGLASSLAFTPVQGLELENPNAQAERVRKANETYFGSRTFTANKEEGK